MQQIAQRSCACLTTGTVQGQVGQDFKQTSLVEDVAKGLELDDLQGAFQPKTFCDSKNHTRSRKNAKNAQFIFQRMMEKPFYFIFVFQVGL